MCCKYKLAHVYILSQIVLFKVKCSQTVVQLVLQIVLSQLRSVLSSVLLVANVPLEL